MKLGLRGRSCFPLLLHESTGLMSELKPNGAGVTEHLHPGRRGRPPRCLVTGTQAKGWGELHHVNGKGVGCPSRRGGARTKAAAAWGQGA
jgi:hypothetical protein